MNQFLISFGNDTVCILRHIILPQRETEKEKLIAAHAFVLLSRKVDILTYSILDLNSGLHLHSKYLIRKRKMAHFVGCHQWIFSNFQEKLRKVNTNVK